MSRFALPRLTACLLAVFAVLALSASRPAAAQFVSFSYNVTNPSATAQAFSLNISQPTITLAPGGTLVLTLGGTMTDDRGDGVSVTPISPSTSLLSGGGDGLTLLSTGPAFSMPSGAAGATYTYPTATSNYVTTTALTSLNANLSFSLSAGDSAFFNGSLRYVPAANGPAPVPEPAPAAALGLGLLGLAALTLTAKKRKVSKAV